MSQNNPQFPIYIPSKSRADSRLTSKALEAMNVPYFIIVEKEQYDEYANVIDKKKILILDKKYQDDYDTCDSLGDTKSKGPGAARNFAWQHSIDNGNKWHWVMDDNIKSFKRYNKNKRIACYNGTPFKVMEDFVLRYKEAFYSGEGTLPKSKMQVALHPDVSKLKWRFGRWHHIVDYSQFKRNNRLMLNKQVKIDKGINNYGLKLKTLG